MLLFGSPSLFLILHAASIYEKGIEAGVFVFFIILGVSISPVYLKIMHGLLANLIESKKAPWLVEPLEVPFNETYQIPWNRSILGISFILTTIMDFWLIKIALLDGNALRYSPFLSFLWILILVIGHIGISIMLYISILSYIYVLNNSKIYDLSLVSITKRVRGYTDGHESILSKKNYEVVGVLSDTPGLSVRSLGDIPLLGLICATAIINAIFFIIASPFFIEGTLSEITVENLGRNRGITIIILMGLVISLIASLGAIIIPIGRAWWVIRRFKFKALTELDPFLYSQITDVALNRDSLISNETQVLYMLRNFIYSMKQSPLNPLRMIQITAIIVFYAWRGVPAIIAFLEIISGVFT
jgi:hypothetical protein